MVQHYPAIVQCYLWNTSWCWKTFDIKTKTDQCVKNMPGITKPVFIYAHLVVTEEN